MRRAKSERDWRGRRIIERPIVDAEAGGRMPTAEKFALRVLGATDLSRRLAFEEAERRHHRGPDTSRASTARLAPTDAGCSRQ
jgi:hypothetical protein